MSSVRHLSPVEEDNAIDFVAEAYPTGAELASPQNNQSNLLGVGVSLPPQLSTKMPVFVAVEVATKIDRDAFEGALQSLVDRHSALRGNFQSESGALGTIESVGCVTADFAVTDVKRSEDTVDIDEFIHRSIYEPFDLQAPARDGVSLLRSRLLFQQGRRWLIISAPAEAVDNWSLVVLLKDLKILYQSRTDGIISLPDIEMDFPDHCRWQQDILCNPNENLAQKLTKFWADELSRLPILEFPIDYPRPPVLQNKTASISVKIPIQAISNSARMHRVSLRVLLSSVVHLFVYRKCRQKDITIAHEVACRFS